MSETFTKDHRVLSDHPIAPEMRSSVMDALTRIEHEESVTVLFACESGSRGWGFASPDSDYDVRFIYVNRLPWYLTVMPGRDVIERPISGDLDVAGWDLRKALRLLQKSNPTLLEWLRSPIAYLEKADVTDTLRRLAVTHFSDVSGYHHYMSMAKKNFREHLRGDVVRYKKYFYVLRPLLAARWIREGRGAPPMRFADLAEATVTDAGLIGEINALLEVKMRAGEAATSPRWPAIHEFIVNELTAAAAYAPVDHVRRSSAELDSFLSTTVRRFDSMQRPESVGNA